jgi:hypothetical protein
MENLVGLLGEILSAARATGRMEDVSDALLDLAIDVGVSEERAGEVEAYGYKYGPAVVYYP